MIVNERSFALYFAGQSLSTLGDRMAFVALPFAVLAIGGTAADVGLVAAAALLPMLLVAPVSGVWADVLPRHVVMALSDWVRGSCQAAAAVLLLTGAARVWHLVALMVLYGVADAFFSPACTGLLPLVVPPERVQEANALVGTAKAVALVAGPALAGLVVAVSSPGVVLAFDAATFAARAVLLALLRLPPSPPEPRGPFLRMLRDGFAHVVTRPWVGLVLVAAAMYHVVALPGVYVLGPIMAQDRFAGVGTWALVITAFGVGALIGNVLSLRMRPRRPLVVAVLALLLASGQPLVIALVPSVVVIALLEAVAGAAFAVFSVLWTTALQNRVPVAVLSRVGSYNHLVSTGLMPVGLALAGPLAESAGTTATLVWMTCLAAPVIAAVALAPSVRAPGGQAPSKPSS
ncbi:MFS transporter [Actinokineospora sp. 24-640]